MVFKSVNGIQLDLFGDQWLSLNERDKENLGSVEYGWLFNQLGCY